MSIFPSPVSVMLEGMPGVLALSPLSDYLPECHLTVLLSLSRAEACSCYLVGACLCLGEPTLVRFPPHPRRVVPGPPLLWVFPPVPVYSTSLSYMVPPKGIGHDAGGPLLLPRQSSSPPPVHPVPGDIGSGSVLVPWRKMVWSVFAADGSHTSLAFSPRFLANKREGETSHEPHLLLSGMVCGRDPIPPLSSHALWSYWNATGTPTASPAHLFVKCDSLQPCSRVQLAQTFLRVQNVSTFAGTKSFMRTVFIIPPERKTCGTPPCLSFDIPSFPMRHWMGLVRRLQPEGRYFWGCVSVPFLCFPILEWN